MTPLAAHADGRDNRLTAIRLAAALAVLVSHAWPLTLGPGAAEPLAETTGRTLGTWAVMVFFALSGFLIAGSWARVPRAGRFLGLRAARLLPGLWAALILVALVMGPMVTALPWRDYLTDPALWRHLAVNGSLIALDPALPGVFDANPYPALQGSIWTLGYEALCYLALLALGLSGALARDGLAGAVLGLAMAAATLVLALGAEAVPIRLYRLAELGLPFAAGALIWHARAAVPLSGALAAALVALALVAAGTPAGPPATALAVAYGTLWLGLAPGPGRKAAARLPDYSYGLYLYAFPVQALAVHLGDPAAGPQSPWVNVALAVPLTLALAALSWHLVERPCLDAARRRTAHRPAASTGPRATAPGATAPAYAGAIGRSSV